MGSFFIMNQQITGRSGEDRAVAYLQAHGFTILARNWRTRWGEIDIIACRGATLYFFEVKTRGTQQFGHPYAAVTPFKRKKILWTAQAYLSKYPLASNQTVAFGAVAGSN